MFITDVESRACGRAWCGLKWFEVWRVTSSEDDTLKRVKCTVYRKAELDISHSPQTLTQRSTRYPLHLDHFTPPRLLATIVYTYTVACS